MVRDAWDFVLDAEPELAAMFAEDPEAGLETAAWLASCRESLQGYFDLEDPRRLEPAEREVYVEALLDSRLLLRGFVDRIDIAPDGSIRVVDYKTGNSPGIGFESKALFQMRFYALVIWRTRGVVPKLLQLIYLGDGQVVSYRPDEDDLRATERLVEALWRAIEDARRSGEWLPSPGAFCKWCSFQEHCPAFGNQPPPLPVVAVPGLLRRNRSRRPRQESELVPRGQKRTVPRQTCWVPARRAVKTKVSVPARLASTRRTSKEPLGATVLRWPCATIGPLCRIDQYHFWPLRLLSTSPSTSMRPSSGLALTFQVPLGLQLTGTPHVAVLGDCRRHRGAQHDSGHGDGCRGGECSVDSHGCSSTRVSRTGVRAITVRAWEGSPPLDVGTRTSGAAPSPGAAQACSAARSCGSSPTRVSRSTQPSFAWHLHLAGDDEHAAAGGLGRGRSRLRVLDRQGLSGSAAQQLGRPQVGLGMRLAVRDLVAADHDIEGPLGQCPEHRLDEPTPGHGDERARDVVRLQRREQLTGSRSPRHLLLDPLHHSDEELLDDLARRQVDPHVLAHVRRRVDQVQADDSQAVLA